MRLRWLVTPLFCVPLAVLAHCGGDDGALPTVSADAGDAAAEGGSVEDADAAPSPDAATLAPTEPQLLATSPGKDEDPSLVRATGGTFYAAWYSNRDGSDRIWMKSSANGRDWSPDRAVTPASEHHFYPSLIQTKDGRFHLVTWVGSLSDAGAIVGAIRYASSADTITWDAPVLLTDASAFAWCPTISERAAGQLVVTWSSDASGDKDIYLRMSNNGGKDWPSPATHRTDTAFNDDIPILATRADGSLLLLWQRFDPSVKTMNAPFEHPSNELVYATSPDGTTWSAPVAVTSDPPATMIPDVISALFPSSDPTGFSVAWSSVRGTSGSGDLSSLGLSKVPASASNVVQLTNVAGADYSPRLVPAGSPGLYMMAWVSDRGARVDGGPNLDIWYQLLKP